MPKTFKFFIWSGKKAVAFLVLTVVLSVAIVGSTLAYIIVKTNELNNTFTPGEVDISISGSTITNIEDTDVYVRAAVVVTWVNNNGTPDDKTDDVILSTMPVEGTDADYTITYSTDTNWAKGSDGFWYYKSPISKSATVTLIDGVTANTTMEGYTLTVQVLSSAIQATPTEAVTDAWTSVTGVDDNGKLIIITP
ncbi:MAG: hypothetical protein IJW53_03400 [Clostridia bacterium]|nr:hypothetical protein [Clostridia bacterium]